MKNDREIGGQRLWERRKIKRKKRHYNNRKVFRRCRQTLITCKRPQRSTLSCAFISAKVIVHPRACTHGKITNGTWLLTSSSLLVIKNSCDKSLYTKRKLAKWQHNTATKTFDYTTIATDFGRSVGAKTANQLVR